MTPITKDGEYTTRSGLPVRIYATDAGGMWPVQGAIKTEDGWEMEEWSASGNYVDEVQTKPHANDLIPKPKVRKLDCWVNVYLIDGMVRIGADYSSKDNADEAHGAHERMACIHIQRDVAEGEGLT